MAIPQDMTFSRKLGVLKNMIALDVMSLLRDPSHLFVCLFIYFFQAKELATLYKLRQLFVKDLQARLKVVR